MGILRGQRLTREREAHGGFLGIKLYIYLGWPISPHGFFYYHPNGLTGQLDTFIATSGMLAIIWDFPGGSDGEASAYSAGDQGSVPGLGRSGEGHGNPLQSSCLEKSHGWRSLVGYGVPKSRT